MGSKTPKTRTFHHQNLSFWFPIVHFLFLLPSLSSISFNRTDFKGWPEIDFDGDAGVFTRKLTLIDSEKNPTNIDSTGRAFFSEKMHLWDNASRKFADFDTTFSFSMTSTDYDLGLGDGFAFFLSNNDSQIPVNSSGACLALISECANSLANGLVAVEFDNFQNSWDTSSAHIGIDVNSIRSTATTAVKNWTSGKIGRARIWYDSQTENLSVSLYYLGETYNLSQAINLSKFLAERVTFGFSAATGALTSRHDIHSWEFNSTELPISMGGNSTKEEEGGINLALVLSFVFGGAFLVFIVALFFTYCYRKRTIKDDLIDVSMDWEFEYGIGAPRRFSYNELVHATNNFAGSEKLGEGGFGEVYKGYLSDLNLTVAVKRVSKQSKQGRKEYVSEVKIISRVKHRNLVQLIGWCHEKGEFLLIYEFMPNGSLDFHLFRGSKTGLSWEIRYKVAVGLASAILYLHEESEKCVLHRDIKSSNIMLDSNFNAKLGDFGLARLIDEAAGQRTTALAGTLGYMAPEYVSTGKASKASDVFSFGVVALEIACGRKSIEAKFDEARASLVSWVWNCYGNERLLDVVDERLCMEFNVKEMESLLIVGLWCVHPDHKSRPSIRQAIQVLNLESPLPDLPKNMPVPSYNVPIPLPVSYSEPQVSYSSLVVGR
ncbi:hypothetical protein UlMin_032492 [Ulmus minor]